LRLTLALELTLTGVSALIGTLTIGLALGADKARSLTLGLALPPAASLIGAATIGLPLRADKARPLALRLALTEAAPLIRAPAVGLAWLLLIRTAALAAILRPIRPALALALVFLSLLGGLPIALRGLAIVLGLGLTRGLGLAAEPLLIPALLILQIVLGVVGLPVRFLVRILFPLLALFGHAVTARLPIGLGDR
jgi:hypothetical protein